MTEKLKGFGMATAPQWMKPADYKDNGPSTAGSMAIQLRELADEVAGECRINRHRADFLLLAAAERLDEAHMEWLHIQCQRLQATLDIFSKRTGSLRSPVDFSS